MAGSEFTTEDLQRGLNPIRKIAIVINGVSRKKKFFYEKLLPAVTSDFQVEVMETRAPDHAIELAASATRQKIYDVILAAGGDGTLNQVVNGVISAANGKMPGIGIIPLGSGNDFAKTIGASATPSYLRTLLQRGTSQKLNVGLVQYLREDGQTGERYFINVADAGMGPEVVSRVAHAGRAWPAEAAYYKGILSTFLSYKMMDVHVEADGWDWKGKLRSFAVANGKYYGHGLCIAPDAKPGDDVFTAFICGNVSVLDFVMQTATLKSGRFVKLEEVSYRTCTNVSLKADKRCMIEADGEVLGVLPATISLSPIRINFLA